MLLQYLDIFLIEYFQEIEVLCFKVFKQNIFPQKAFSS